MAEEKESGLFPLQNDQMTHSSSTYTNQNYQLNISSMSEVKGLSFSDGIAHYVSSVIMTEADRQRARARAYTHKEDGSTVQEKILNINQKMTAGKLVIQCRFHHSLEKYILDQAKERETS